MTHSVMVLDENKHIKYTFSKPSKFIQPKNKLEFLVDCDTSELELFNETEITGTHFMFFKQKKIEVTCVKEKELSPELSSELSPEFVRADSVLPKLKFKEPVKAGSKIIVNFV